MSTIKQKSVAVEIDGKTVDVRRMRWKEAREFLKKFSALATVLYKDKPDGIAFGALLMSRLTDIVSGSDELVILLIKGSTDFTDDQVNSLDVLSVMELLGAALEVNFDAELKKSWAGVGEKLSALIPASPTTT